MATQERLFLLDGMALAYRAYFAFISRPLVNSKGQNTSAVYGFVTALMKILEDEKPDHIAVVFDTKEPTFRHKKYEPYKATREKMPEDMSSQLGLLKDVVRAFNIPLLELPGYEADDIIGTLAKRAEKEKVLTYMVTPDKDFMQLVAPYIKMYKPGKGGDDSEVVEEKGVFDKFGVEPGKVTDVLGLIGDKSDNIPGVPGVGEKTAIPLIQQYGSMEELYKNVENIPQKGVREKLINNKELAFLSKELVTIMTDVPITINFHELKAARRDTHKLIKLFGELEFKSLAARMRETEPFEDQLKVEPTDASSTPPPPAEVTDITTDEHTYHCVRDFKTLHDLCSKLSKSREFVFDTETTSTNALQAQLIGLSFCFNEREAYYVPVKCELPASKASLFDDRSGQARLPEQSGGQGSLMIDEMNTKPAAPNYTLKALPLKNVLEQLKPLLEDPAIKKVGQNIKYDMLVLHAHGVEVRGVAFDTMVASYVLRADGQHGLDALAKEYLNHTMVSFEDLVGKGKNAKHITAVPLDAIANYSAEDADMTFRISRRQTPRLEELGLLHLCETLEFPLTSVLARMEAAGVSLDLPYLAGMSKELERQLDNLVRDIHRDAGSDFNINSTQQLGEILFNKLKLPAVKKTKTGYSTDVGVLESLRGQHPIIERLLEYRQYAKLKSTYVDALPLLIHPKTGRVHTSYNQAVALTGRLSSSDPNLQNIPIRTELGSAIRKAFIAGNAKSVLLSADYSQIELRIMAHVSGDEGLVGAFRNKEDIHATTAAKVFGVAHADVSKEMRRKAKEVNFGIMYGIGPFGLANRLEITQTEAKDIIARYFERFPKVKQYINDTLGSVRQHGYVETLLGRRRYLTDINSRNQNIRGNAERQAINMPIQGTAADMIKLAMIAIDRELEQTRLKSQMLLQVHDELVFEVVNTEIERMTALVRDKMTNAMKLDVPVEVEVGAGKNWLEAH